MKKNDFIYWTETEGMKVKAIPLDNFFYTERDLIKSLHDFTECKKHLGKSLKTFSLFRTVNIVIKMVRTKILINKISKSISK